MTVRYRLPTPISALFISAIFRAKMEKGFVHFRPKDSASKRCTDRCWQAIADSHTRASGRNEDLSTTPEVSIYEDSRRYIYIKI